MTKKVCRLAAFFEATREPKGVHEDRSRKYDLLRIQGRKTCLNITQTINDFTEETQFCAKHYI